MFQADLLSPWTGTGANSLDPRRHQVADDYTVDECTDLSAQAAPGLPPTPNLGLCRVELDAQVLDALEADPTYHVLTTHQVPDYLAYDPTRARPPNQPPTAAEFGRLRAFLAEHCPAGTPAGDWNREISAHVGDAPNNRTRAQIVAGLKTWLDTWASVQ
jgi:hypothetical protein